MAFSSPDIRRQNDLSNYPTAISCSLAENSRKSSMAAALTTLSLIFGFLPIVIRIDISVDTA